MTFRASEGRGLKPDSRLRAAAWVAIGASLPAALFAATDRAPAATKVIIPTGSAAANIAKATCGAKDRPEAVLQGQVPINERLGGFQGYNCNLQLTAAAHSRRGDVLWQQFVSVRDRAGNVCGYGGPVFFSGALGTTVVDLTHSNHAEETTVITTPGLLQPGEGLRTHEGRGLLVSASYNLSPGLPGEVPHGFDVYDVGTDCRKPQLLFSSTGMKVTTPGASATVSGLVSDDRIYGHEGAMSPDGRTYWVADGPRCAYHAIDIADPRNPKYLGGYASPQFVKGEACAHGLSVSNDGNRVYAASLAPWNGPETLNLSMRMAPADGEYPEGFLVLDTSEIQARKKDAKVRLISETYWYDGSSFQMTIPIKVKGKPYLVTTEEGGVGLVRKASLKAACAAGRTPFGTVKLFDMSDETRPRLVTNLIHEVNDPKNCSLIEPEIAALPDGSIRFMYDVHMCSVDNRDNATTLACSYFDSGIRVYDIRDPANVKEIAYWNPPAKTPGSIGWCGAIPTLDAARGMLYSSCADRGVFALKFTNGVWPFPESTTPADRQL